MFLGFANFYQYYIHGFSQITTPLILMLKTTTFTTTSIGTPPINADKLSFLTSKAKLAFLRLKQVFIEFLVFQYFDPKHYIWIKTNAFLAN